LGPIDATIPSPTSNYFLKFVSVPMIFVKDSKVIVPLPEAATS